MIPGNSKLNRKEVEKLSEKKQEKEAFDIYQDGVANVIDEVAKLQPAYLQSLTNLQQECTEVFKSTTESTITAQKEFANATWGPAKFSTALVRNASEVTDTFLKAATIGNKAIIATVDATTQNVKTFGTTIDTFARINANLVKTWQNFVPSKA